MDPRVRLIAAADPRPEARQQFASDFGGRTYDDVAALCADADVELIYVATPHQYHAEHARLAAAAGKHIIVEKPIALNMPDAEAMIAAASHAGVRLIVGHSHSFDAPILRTRELITSGAFGRVRMITTLNYTDFLLRPRRPEELDTTRGGGVVFNQAPHQVDIVRLLGGGLVASVRSSTGGWDPERPTEGAYSALLNFEDGSYASLNYNGYGQFDSDEFMAWIGELGEHKMPRTKPAVRAFSNSQEEAAAKAARSYGGPGWQPQQAQSLLYQHFGFFIVSCEKADLRPLPNGVMIYEGGTGRFDALAAPAIPRVELMDEVYAAVVEGQRPLHDGAWAAATLEVCLAIRRSSLEGKEIPLHQQVSPL